MKIVIFGASGGTGRELIRQGLAQNHQITAFVRRRESMAGLPIQVKIGDARDADAVSAAIAGQDAVLSALGSPNLRDSTLLPEAMVGILAGMERHGVRRLIVLGAGGIWPGSTRQLSFPGKLMIRLLDATLLKRPFEAQRAMQGLIHGSHTDWTVVQPPLLLDKPGRRRYRVEGDALPLRAAKIARADVAHFMLAQLSSPEWIRKSPFLAW